MAADAGIIDLESVRSQIEMKKKEKYLSQHKYATWQDAKGYWYTYLPDSSKANGRRKVKKASQSKLQDAIIAFYMGDEEARENASATLRSIYPKWLASKEIHTNASGTIQRIDADWRRYYLPSPEIIDTPVKKLTAEQLDLWIHGIIKQYSMTKTCYYNMSMIIRQCLDYAVSTLKILSSNTFREVRINTKLLQKQIKKDDATQVFLKDEVHKIFEAAMQEWIDDPDNTAPLGIMLDFVTGLRKGELSALKVTDASLNTLQVCHMERTEYRVAESGNVVYSGLTVVDGAKTQAGIRSVPLVPLAKEIVAEVLAVNKRNGWYDSGFLFLNKKGERMKSWQFKYRLEKYCDEVGIPRKSIHKIRKTVISALIDSHLSLNEIRKACGHADERTTLGNYCYNRLSRSETADKFDSALTTGNGLGDFQLSIPV